MLCAIRCQQLRKVKESFPSQIWLPIKSWNHYDSGPWCQIQFSWLPDFAEELSLKDTMLKGASGVFFGQQNADSVKQAPRVHANKIHTTHGSSETWTINWTISSSSVCILTIHPLSMPTYFVQGQSLRRMNAGLRQVYPSLHWVSGWVNSGQVTT